MTVLVAEQLPHFNGRCAGTEATMVETEGCHLLALGHLELLVDRLDSLAKEVR